ncbi:MAG: FkbM family methyltransferase [Parcubacteria group bacterium]|nr:FkbM family methyltransferase [Parcubacteria group bacterium]
MLKSRGVLFSLKVFLRAIERFFRKNVLFQEYITKKINSIYLMKFSLRKKAQHRALCLFRTWEELETAIVQKVVKENMHVLDLGANIGYYSFLFAMLVKGQGKVYAVEPLPRNFTQLKENVLLNGLHSLISVENIAISDKTGVMEFFIGRTDNVGSLVKIATDRQTGQNIEVKTFSLVDYLKDKPCMDFIRMDIERGELKIFKNLIERGSELDNKYPKRIFFEIHPIGTEDPDATYTSVLQGLMKIGYCAEYVIPSSNPLAMKQFQSLGYVPEKITSTENLLFRDIRNEHLLEVAARRPKITRAILMRLSSV